MTPADVDTLPAPEMGQEVTVDQFCGGWRIYQLRKGHRFSTDDVVCAWTAVEAHPSGRRLLDLGAGLGSVGLQVLWRMGPTARLTQVEVQEVSHRLSRRTVDVNGLAERVTLRHGDLRDSAMLPEREHGTYDLVLASPPYIPLGSGVVSANPQRAGARMELRGDVFDYCRTAAQALSGDGHIALVHAAGDPRPETALKRVGLQILWRQDVVFRRGRPPTIAVFAAAWKGERQDRPDLVIREPGGEMTDQYMAVRRTMGAPEAAPPAPPA